MSVRLLPFILSALLLPPLAARAAPPDAAAFSAMRAASGPLFATGMGGDAVRAWRGGRNSACADLFEKLAAAAKEEELRSAAMFRAGRCHERAGRFPPAAAAYGAVRTAGGLLAPLAALRLAVVMHEQKAPDEALALLDEVAGDPALGARAWVFRTRVVEAAGRDDDLVARYAGSGSPVVRLKVARARRRMGQVVEAAADLREVFLGWPRSASGAEAREGLAVLSPSCFRGHRWRLPCLTPEERLRLGRGLFSAHASDAVIALLESRLDEPAFQTVELRCPALVLVARSYDKLRKRKGALPRYAEAKSVCAGRPEEADVLYFGGRSAYREDRPKETLAYMEQLHKRLPKHSYNDDAVLYEWAALADLGRKKDAERALEEAMRLYRDGDMRHRIAWSYVYSALKRGKRALALKRIRAIRPKLDRALDYRDAGRLGYWEARLEELRGRRKAATRAYRRVLSEARLSFHALLAYQRLVRLVGARRAGRDLTSALKDGAKPVKGASSSPPLTGAWGRVALLVRMGLTEEASRELDALPAPSSDATLLRVAHLAHRAGAAHLSVRILRRKLPEYQQLPVAGPAEEIWRMAYPRPFSGEVRGHARAAGVDPMLVYSIMREESGFYSAIESWANAVGLMQLLLKTAQKMGSRGPTVHVDAAALRDPDTNIRLGVRYLDYLEQRFGHPALVVSAYNAGDARMKDWLGKRGRKPLDLFIAAIPFRQTRGYTMRVLQSWFRYHVLHGDGPPALDMAAPARVLKKSKAKAKRKVRASKKGKVKKKRRGKRRKKR
jgi:soluble lytic murein transglycosylase